MGQNDPVSGFSLSYKGMNARRGASLDNTLSGPINSVEQARPPTTLSRIRKLSLKWGRCREWNLGVGSLLWSFLNTIARKQGSIFMSKFGSYWRGDSQTGTTDSTDLGPLAMDATSGLGSERLSQIPTTFEDLKAYYGGFYPTEDWVDALEPIPRRQRRNPQRVSVVEALTEREIQRLKDSAAPFLRVAATDLVGMTPLRNRIAGNARVMPSTRIARCPREDGETLTWQPGQPDLIWCPRGHTVDPFELYPQSGMLEIEGPRGDRQEYPYHDAADGKRIYLNGEFMDSLRVYYLIEASRTLGILYHLTGRLAYAERAAAILYDFARAVPHWPKTHRGRPGIAEEDRLRPVTEFPVYAGIWYDKYHTGTRHMCVLAEGYDYVVNAEVWSSFDRLAPAGDARAFVEEELFLYSVKDAIRYDIHYLHPDAALSNYIPYQSTGFILLGRGVGLPELVHYAYWKLKLLAEKTIMADYVFPESMSYAGQQIHGIANASAHGSGYSDPEGFVSSIDGRRFDNLSNKRELPILHQAVETLATMVYPDGNYIQAHDTHHTMRNRKHADIEETRPSRNPSGEGRSLIYPSFGHAFLARGDKDRANHIQAHLHYSGNWGHDHDDMLNLILWSYAEELVSDIGYQLTYNGFAKTASGHNLVVVDRDTQEKVSQCGSLLGWHPSRDGVQVVEVSAPEVYSQCTAYRRTLFLVPAGANDNLILDIFEVAGGSTHEWMAQGSCMAEQRLESSVPTAFYAESYADDGNPFEPPAHAEWEKELLAQGLKPKDVNPWYGVFRDVHKGSFSGPFSAIFKAEDDQIPDVRLHMLEPGDGDLYTATVPTLRQCWSNALQIEDHSLVEQFRMPKLIVRREGENLRSRFTALWEPVRNNQAVDAEVKIIVSEQDVLAVQVTTGKQEVELFYSPDPSGFRDVGNGMGFEGRYATVQTVEGNREITLYDCTRFNYQNLELAMPARPFLRLLEMREDNDQCVLVLDGVWEGLSERECHHFEEPELAYLFQEGIRGRAFPVNKLERGPDSMLLYCDRHPGFEYDLGSRILEEIFTPFEIIEGQAEVRIPNRGWIRYNTSRSDGLQVRTTGGMTLADRRVDRCADWTEVVLVSGREDR